MGDFLGKFAEAILDAFKRNYKKPKLWIILILVAIVILLLFPYIDSNIFYYSRMQNRINILKEIMEIDQEKLCSNEIFQREYNSILKEIEEQREKTVYSIIDKLPDAVGNLFLNKQSQTMYWLKFITSSILFFIFDICILFAKTFNKKSDKLLAFILLLGIGMFFGWIGTMIPTFIIPAINYVGIPILELIGIMMLVSKSNKDK